MSGKWKCWEGGCAKFIVILLFQCSMVLSNNYVTFEDQYCEKFNHMAIHNLTEKVYIGGVNRIYQLSKDLKLESIAIMGQKEDSPNCPVTRNCPGEIKQPMDYYNKILIINYPQNNLIACGNLFQGVCTVHNLNNVCHYETPANESVVANDATASTVAFIASGPSKVQHTRVLYVGVTYTDNGPYMMELPAVSSRSLEPNNMFKIAHIGSEISSFSTKIHINSLSRNIYPITYIYGFSFRGFSYFVTVQKKDIFSPKPFISKLIRLCQKDENYYSYTEVPLICRISDGTNYNLAQAAYVGTPGSELAESLGITVQDEVLFVVFSKSQDEADNYNIPSSNSALCIYDLLSVHKKFTENIQNCFKGNGSHGLDFIYPSQQCLNTHLQITDDFCGIDDINTHIDGRIPIEEISVLTYSDVILTAVAVISHEKFTVAFLGTSTGQLRKVIIESVINASEYNNIIIDHGKAINKDMCFDKNKDFLYVMTNQKLTMVKIHECQTYETCNDCLDDPFCGWCSSENKCSVRSNCSQSSYWLSYKNRKCTAILSVHPPHIQRTTARILNISLKYMPASGKHFFCTFAVFGKTFVTNATRSKNGVNCASPHPDSLSPILPGKHHFIAKLYVGMENGPAFDVTDFVFYDCTTYIFCTQCVSSQFPCAWCTMRNRCTHDAIENCRNDILITGISITGPSIHSGSEFCPRIDSFSDGSTEILVPSNTSRRIQVKVNNLQAIIATTRFVCLFNIEGRIRQVTAQLLGDTIYCDKIVLQYEAKKTNIIATFAVIWESTIPLDNPENIQILIYKCERMADNCGECFELPEKYACGWCQEKPASCQVHDHCNDRNPAVWLDRYQTCPYPEMKNIKSAQCNV